MSASCCIKSVKNSNLLKEGFGVKQLIPGFCQLQ